MPQFLLSPKPRCPHPTGRSTPLLRVSFRYAHAPQAKGKIERQHQYWQGRRPALFAAEGITAPEAGNRLLPELRRHRNTHEIHREIGRTPNAAARAARREERPALRPAPRCPWWPYIWRQRTTLKVGPDGRMPIATQRLRVGVSPGTRVIHCQHSNGNITIPAHEPKAGQRPAALLQVTAR